MIKQKKKETGILVDEKRVQSGSFTAKDGKVVEYPDSHKLFILPVNQNEVQTYKALKSAELEIEKSLCDAHFGALIELTFEGKNVTAVKVLCDLLYDYEQNNSEVDLFDNE